MFGGVFSPAMFVGVTAGAVAGRLLAMLGLSVAGPGLAICGMAAVAASVIGAPVAGVLIILEMTMSYEFALAAMLSVVIATMVSNVIFGHSFFDRQLLDRGIDVAQGRGHIGRDFVNHARLCACGRIGQSRQNLAAQMAIAFTHQPFFAFDRSARQSQRQLMGQ